MCLLDKPENLSFLAQILFELSQKKDGVKSPPPRPDRVNIKMAEPIGLKCCVVTHEPTGKVNG